MYFADKNQIIEMAVVLAARSQLYGPVQDPVSGQTFFEKISDPHQLDLSAPIPTNPPKHVVFPQTDPIMAYRYDQKAKIAEIRGIDSVKPKTLFGLRSCDLEGLLCLDRFFLGQEFVDDFYLAHRKQLFIVSNTCSRPFPQCFCVCTDSGPSAREGFDINLIEWKKNSGYLVEVGSPQGDEFIQGMGLDAAPADAEKIKTEIVNASINQFEKLATENKAWISRVTNRVTTGFVKEETWEYIGEQCFECGACSFVCPSCSCFNIEDVCQGCETTRIREWDSCSYEGYTRMAGDHNPRKPVEDRRNKRFFCKLSYSQSKKYLRPGCVGCGRCAWVCPGDIGLPNVVTYIRREITCESGKEK